MSVDEFSGSKFKLFTVVDLVNSDEIISPEVISELLFDIGTVSRINTAKGNEQQSPSLAYYDELMTDKIDVFQMFKYSNFKDYSYSGKQAKISIFLLIFHS